MQQPRVHAACGETSSQLMAAVIAAVDCKHCIRPTDHIEIDAPAQSPAATPPPMQDLIFTLQSTTIAAMVAKRDGTAADIDADFQDRLLSMARTFKQCFCLLPHTLASDPLVVELVCGNRCAQRALFHFLGPDDDATQAALALADALLAGVQDAAAAPAEVLNLEEGVLQQEHTSLALQMVAAVTTEEALLSNLLALPGLHEQEAWSLLSTFGSVDRLVQASAEEMVEYAGCSHEHAVQLWELWSSAGGQHCPAAAAALLNV